MNQITRTLLYMCAANIILVALIACGDGDEAGRGGSDSVAVGSEPGGSGTHGGCESAQFRPTFDGIIRSHFLEWLPDGEHILAEGGVDLHLVSTDGSQVTRLAERVFDWIPSRYGRYVDISPDGTQVLYVSCDFVQETHERSRPVHAHEIMVVDVDSAEVTRLTENLEDDHLPVWSPDGSRIAYLSKDGNKGWHVHTAAADGSGLVDLTPFLTYLNDRYSGVDFFPPAWSPDGNDVAFVGWEKLGEAIRSFIYTARTHRDDLESLDRIAETLTQPAWSPDGERLAYFGPKGEDGVALYTINADGSDRQEVVGIVGQEGQWRGELSWSPDGTQIRSSYYPAFVINTDGSGCRSFHYNLHPGLITVSGVVAWSPDSSRVAIFTMPYTSPVIETMSADGSDQRVLAVSTVDEYGNPRGLTTVGASSFTPVGYQQPCTDPIEVPKFE